MKVEEESKDKSRKVRPPSLERDPIFPPDADFASVKICTANAQKERERQRAGDTERERERDRLISHGQVVSFIGDGQ